jgi:hypothetical protein
MTFDQGPSYVKERRPLMLSLKVRTQMPVTRPTSPPAAAIFICSKNSGILPPLPTDPKSRLFRVIVIRIAVSGSNLDTPALRLSSGLRCIVSLDKL